jgi:hypothetical protein
VVNLRADSSRSAAAIVFDIRGAIVRDSGGVGRYGWDVGQFLRTLGIRL